MFESEFCRVEFAAQDNAVFLSWKKECSGDDYRSPVRYALRLAQQHAGSGLIIDARNGFEDEPGDVAWGFSEFLPQLAQAGCKRIALIMNEVSDIEGEMDMWSKEFRKYFEVSRETSYEAAARRIGTGETGFAFRVGEQADRKTR